MFCLNCNRVYTFETATRIFCVDIIEDHYTYHCPFCGDRVGMGSIPLPEGESKEIDARHIC